MVRISGQNDDEGKLKALGIAIRNARKASEMSQEAFADAAGIDRSHMGKIERGERNVTFLNIIKIAHALGTSATDLFAAAEL